MVKWVGGDAKIIDPSEESLQSLCDGFYTFREIDAEPESDSLSPGKEREANRKLQHRMQQIALIKACPIHQAGQCACLPEDELTQCEVDHLLKGVTDEPNNIDPASLVPVHTDEVPEKECKDYPSQNDIDNLLRSLESPPYHSLAELADPEKKATFVAEVVRKTKALRDERKASDGVAIDDDDEWDDWAAQMCGEQTAKKAEELLLDNAMASMGFFRVYDNAGPEAPGADKVVLGQSAAYSQGNCATELTIEQAIANARSRTVRFTECGSNPLALEQLQIVKWLEDLRNVLSVVEGIKCR